jgi:integrase
MIHPSFCLAGRFESMIRPCLQDLAGQGFTLEDAKRLLGHSSIVLTSNTYGHVLEQRQQQVASGMDAVLGR